MVLMCRDPIRGKTSEVTHQDARPGEVAKYEQANRKQTAVF